MTLDELTPLLEAWYETPPGGLGLGEEKTASVRNPTLRKFYARLGKLTEPDSPWWRFGSQDEFFPVDALRQQEGLTIFAAENQGNFVIAASDDLAANAFAQGDGIDLDSIPTLSDTGVPLEELIVTFALLETVWTSEPFEREFDAELAARARVGNHYRGRYVQRGVNHDLWLTNDVILTEFGGHELVAPKGAWRKEALSEAPVDRPADWAGYTPKFPTFGALLFPASIGVAFLLFLSRIPGFALLVGFCAMGAVIGFFMMVMAWHRQSRWRKIRDRAAEQI